MLKPSDRERLQDCLLLIQSVPSILLGVKPGTVPEILDIQKCFLDADQSISRLLTS